MEELRQAVGVLSTQSNLNQTQINTLLGLTLAGYEKPTVEEVNAAVVIFYQCVGKAPSVSNLLEVVRIGRLFRQMVQVVETH